MKFYKDRFGKWYKENHFFGMAQVFLPAFPGGIFSEKMFVDSGVITEIKEFKNEPSVIEYLKFGMKIEAVFRYYRLHNSSLAKAREMVDLMSEDLRKNKK